uniref:EGF-like domain-containing protein n=1 Tax=Corethron hystrix TaxID=216773 RepID=A0A7S1BUG1_9STRA|mmetsp:Transcript_41590/g.97355  ORF Transcript_41590/g.97355 Transcript_41590/m.97355 type:complete len:230 (+) Transcript_41590:132-821(+)
MYAHKISICLTAIIVSVLTWSTDAQVSQNNLRINSQLDNPELLAFAEDVERRIAGNDKNKSNSKKNNNKDNKNEEDKEKEKREAEAKMRETAEPSSNPTQEPTTPPTSSPSISPTISPKPTESPTTSPSKFPTLSPTPLFDRKLGETCSGDGSCLSGNCFKPATSAPHGVCQCNLCTEIGGMYFNHVCNNMVSYHNTYYQLFTLVFALHTVIVNYSSLNFRMWRVHWNF